MKISILFFSISVLAGLETWAASPLEKAYQEEIKLLASERQQLISRKRAIEKKYNDEIAALRQEVSKISEQVTALQIENQALEDRVSKGEDEVQVGSDRQALLDNTLDQAISTLRHHGITIAHGEEDLVPLLGAMFEKGCLLVRRLGRLRIEKDSYFAADGSERKGDVLWLSQVAAFSLDHETGGSLGPAGSQNLKVVHHESVKQAEELSRGKCPKIVGTLLFDPLEHGDTVSREHRTLWKTFLAGGFVMWPILALAVLAVLILFERIFILRKAHTNSNRLMKEVGKEIAKGDWGKAAEDCHKRPGAVARVLETILRHRELPRSQLEELVNESILAERPTLERFLPALNVIAAVAPLLGLLGTVTGMIGTFLVITEHGTGDPRLLSGGISEALLTTEFGLIVAIPTLLVHALLSSRVDHVLSDMEINALKLLNKMQHEKNERGHNTAGMHGDDPKDSVPVETRGAINA
ncbi:MAG: hypothetical protein GXP49_02870 [Deltaproteobacteria bacterium]|nr:hypothetical protein [Deltaproteobacteria bacterium]